jgi:hypothetical protein
VQSAPPAAASIAATSALSAFLRGIERRAFVFALVQCGDEFVAQLAVSRAMQSFRTLSELSPLSAWPAGFWSLLLAQAELGGGDSEVPELARLGSGPRAALLLRLVAGLDFAHAAQVLGVSEETYRFALQRALQQLGDAGISYAALSALRERLHRTVKTLPGARTEALAALRQRALTATPEPEPPPPAPTPPTSPWLRRALWGLFALLMLGFAATFLERAPVLDPGRTEPLPAETRPAPAAIVAHSEADTVSHPDYRQLATPDAGRIGPDLALLSWLATHPDTLGATVAAPAAVTALAPATAAPASFPALDPGQRRLLAPFAAAWAGLDGPTRSRLQANAAHWQGLDAAGRAALQARLRTWDELPAPERARQRAPFAAWEALPPAEQAHLFAVLGTFVALPAERQQALRDEFAALPAEQRRDWWLGPGLGADFAGLQPLVAFVPDDELGEVLSMLRALPAEARVELAQLSRRLPPGERGKLREALLAAPTEQRAALIRSRLGQ